MYANSSVNAITDSSNVHAITGAMRGATRATAGL